MALLHLHCIPGYRLRRRRRLVEMLRELVMDRQTGTATATVAVTDTDTPRPPTDTTAHFGRTLAQADPSKVDQGMRASVYVEMLKRTGLAVVLTLYFCPPALATQCTAKHLAQHVLGAPRSQLPRDGGIVVASTSVAGTAPTSAAPAWSLQINGHSANIAPTTLAPGLVVYRAGAAAKRIAVFEGKTGRAGATVTDSYATPLNAPQPSSVVYAANPEFVGVKMTVTLATAAPADAIALIAYDARSRARTWGAVTAGATTIIVYNDELCRPVPAGTIEPSAGEKITLAWVDAAGGVSELSAPLVITQ